MEHSSFPQRLPRSVFDWFSLHRRPFSMRFHLKNDTISTGFYREMKWIAELHSILPRTGDFLIPAEGCPSRHLENGVKLWPKNKRKKEQSVGEKGTVTIRVELECKNGVTNWIQVISQRSAAHQFAKRSKRFKRKRNWWWQEKIDESEG